MSERDRYGLLFELSRDAVAEIEIVDSIPIVRAVNPAFVEVFGYDREAIVGESLNEFIVPDQRSGEASTFDQRTADGEVNSATIERKTADGIREFLYRGVPFERNGASYGLAVYTDITDQRRREQHHQVLHRVLRHNLRNDLTQILAATEELLTATDDDAVVGNARRIRAAVDDLGELSDAASRVEDMLGADHVERKPIDMVETLSQLVERYESPATARVETELHDTLYVTADHRLGAALGALVENAVEHGQTDSEPAPVVHISTTAAESEAVVRITDNGGGIPDYERAAIFDDRALSQLSHGSGLGLWLAKWVVESYGGRLTYDRYGGQTTVSVRVPLATDRETQRRESSA